MLKSFTVSNFYSIGLEPQSVSLEVSKKDCLNESFSVVGSQNFTLIAGLVGANGSGKSNILKGLSFLISWINDSYLKVPPLIGSSYDYSQGIGGYKAHALHQDKESCFTIEFYNEQDLYRYKLVLNGPFILNEVLEKKTNTRFKKIFSLSRHGEKLDLSISTELNLNKSDKERFLSRCLTVPIFSSLLNTGYLPKILFFKRSYLSINQSSISSYPSAAERHLIQNQNQDSKLEDKTIKLMKSLDIGISDHFFLDLQDTNKKMLCLRHKTLTGAEFDLFLHDESHGTRTAFNLFLKIIPVLEEGGLIVIDEIETNIHPHLIQKILSLFMNKKINKYNAQILFSTHQALLLKELTKTQIFIVEKNKEDLTTEIYRLDEVEGVRNDENYAQKYLSGTYGGVPDIDWLNRGF